MITKKIDELLQKHLQKSVAIEYDHKYVKRGTFLLYNISGVNLNLILKTNKNDNRNYELPIPFDIDEVNGNIELDYTLILRSGSPLVKAL